MLANLPRPRRPGFNSAGRPVKVLVNYFGVKLNLTEAHHYDVAIVGLKQPRGGAPRASPSEVLQWSFEVELQPMHVLCFATVFKCCAHSCKHRPARVCLISRIRIS